MGLIITAEGTKISELPPYPGFSTTGDLPISIAGVTYRIRPNQIVVVAGSGTTEWLVVAAGGVEATFSELVNKAIVGSILRGGLGTGKLITSGTVTGNQIKFTTGTGKLEVHADVPFFTGEELTITYI